MVRFYAQISVLIKELETDFIINRKVSQTEMVKFTVEEVRKIMNYPENIRNMSVIAHVDHGKTTLSDALICRAGILSRKMAGDARVLDNREDEAERGITIKSTGVSMYYQYDLEGNGNKREYLINLIDSPGHVDFSSEVTAALRVTDGALVIVDTVEGVCVQTETVLRQAMQEKIKPILMINKVDRAIMELKLGGEEIYQQFRKVIDKVNAIVSGYETEEFSSIMPDPAIGNVVFGAGKDQWGFTLRTFARIYSKKFGIKEEKMMDKLWGDNYFDPETNKWTDSPVSQSGKPLERGFVEFIMKPICVLSHSIMNSEKEVYEKLMTKIGVELDKEEKKEGATSNKKLMKIVLSKWIHAADCLLEAMILHLPSPVEAQKYRTEYLYEGPLEDEAAEAMRKCDPKGPLMVYISKMVPLNETRFVALGRIFSGTVTQGQRVRILGVNYKAGEKVDLYEKNLTQVGVYMLRKIPEYTGDIPCGNIVAITGIDDYLLKTGTVTGTELQVSHPIRAMKYSVSPVYRVAVCPKNPADLPKLEKGLVKLSKSDPLLKVEVEETGERIIAGSGELHIEICISDLKKYAGCELIVSDPTVTYKETITETSEPKLLTKSANKHNRLWGNCTPLDAKLVEMIETEEIGPKVDQKAQSKILIDQFDWDKTQANKIWCFGPENMGPNILIDSIKQGQYVQEVKGSICSAFQNATKHGVLAEESMRGILFNLVDTEVHPDPIHRNDAQLMPSAKRLFQGLQLSASPTLYEPIFMCEISAPIDVLGGVYQTLTQRRGTIIEEAQLDGNTHVVKAYLPVAESFGLTSHLRQNTHGKAFPQCFFDHWDLIKGLPYEDPKATGLVIDIRKRKGLKAELPVVQNYLDKL